MKILAVETSCDETAMAILDGSGGLRRPRFKVLKSVVSSQIEVHRPYGGVFPALAKREHIKNLPEVLAQVVGEGATADNAFKKIDAIAVTVGPGLEPALWTGIEFAKELAAKYDKPLVGANHLEGHLLSPLLSLKEKDENIPLPAIGLVVSGGHTILLTLKKINEWKKIGETRDDAVGEAYDKVARLIGLPYPGGPEIDRIAKNGNPNAVDFPRPMIHHKNYDFSFSGLKTAVYYHVRAMEERRIHAEVADIAASFQAAAIDVLVAKTARAIREHGAKSLLLGGGVAANSLLRDSLKKEARKSGVKFSAAEMKYSGDNAAMIAAAAYIGALSGKKFRIKAQANLNL